MRAHLGGGGDGDFSTNLLHLGDGSVPNDDSFTEIDEKLGHSKQYNTVLIAKFCAKRQVFT